MPKVHTHRDACDKEIEEGEEDIITVVKGKSELQNSEMLLSWDKELWFGHARCHEQPLQSAQAFLHGVVYQELCNSFRDNYHHGRLVELFKINGWPMGG